MQLMTDDPEDQVRNWASRTYSPTPTSYTPPAQAQPTPAPAPAPSVNTNVANWYQNVLGRQPDAAGLNYWQNAVNSGGNVQDLYKQFVTSASANHEATVNSNTSWAAANSAPSTPAPFTQASQGPNPLYTPTTAPATTPPKTTTPTSAVSSPIATALGAVGTAMNAVTNGATAAGTTPPPIVQATSNVINTVQKTSMPAPVMTSATPDYNVLNWYRNELGRDARPDEVAYWQGVINSGMAPQTAFSEFLKAAATNKETVTPTSWEAANAASTGGYKPAPSANTPAPSTTPTTPSATTGGQVRPGTTTPAPSTYQVPNYVNVSAWYLNELGRLPTASETAYWQDQLTKSPDPQTVYAQFATSAKANGETVTPVSWAQANSYSPKASSSNSIIPPAAPAVDWTALAAATKAPDIDWSKLTVPQIDWSKMPTIPTTDWSKMTPDITLPTMPEVTIPELTPTQIQTQALAQRNIQANETVDGQLQMLLAENNPVLQQQRAQAMRAAADRGMGNSALAASGADDAMTKAATAIAAQDAGTYGKAADYNVTANNQAIMWNADTAAQAERLQAQLKDAAATRQQQLYTSQMNQATEAQKAAQQLMIAQMQDNTQRAQYAQQMAQAQIQDQTQRAQLAQNLAIAQMQDATARANAAQQLAIAQMQDATNRNQQTNQLTIAQMQDATQRFQSELSSSTSRYNTDSSYKQQMDSQRNSLANNIIMNMELSPDRKAAMLEQLGLGTSASRNPDGSVKYGTGLAGAVYVLNSTSDDLNFSGKPGTGGNGYYSQM